MAPVTTTISHSEMPYFGCVRKLTNVINIPICPNMVRGSWPNVYLNDKLKLWWRVSSSSPSGLSFQLAVLFYILALRTDSTFWLSVRQSFQRFYRRRWLGNNNKKQKTTYKWLKYNFWLWTHKMYIFYGLEKMYVLRWTTLTDILCWNDVTVYDQYYT